MQPAPAPRFSATPGAIQGPPPAIGAHDQEALSDWGFSDRDIGALKTAGALAYTIGDGKYVGFHTEMSEVIAADIDPWAGTAVELNAAENGVAIGFTAEDLIGKPVEADIVIPVPDSGAPAG